ncbi:2Fe-2S iron-sulfur cluster-binding protein [Halorussus halobius]|uniref:2Fe-2S iron-sulfur cluster-binding protein n=1 Tax=Halorussus halobius TaxID=1710537 RepID=UPI0010926454
MRVCQLNNEVTSYTVEIEVPEDCGIEQAGETVTVEVPETEYVLSAARSQGVWLPADCQQGWCTTCAARLLDGEVDQSDAKRYYDADEAAGLVLPCTAKPASDLRIRACQYDAMLDHRASHDLPPGRSKR